MSVRMADQREALDRILRLQAELPPEWKDEAYHDLDDPEEFGLICSSDGQSKETTQRADETDQ